MQMLMLVFNEAIDEVVLETIQDCGIESYTRIDGVFGKGKTSGTHLGTDIWPGRNNTLLLAVSEEQARQAMERLRKLRTKLGIEGVKAFVWNLEDVT